MVDYINDIGLILGGAIACSGVIQLLKNFFKKMPSQVWAAILIPLAIVYMIVPAEYKTALVIAAVAQLGYERLIQPAKDKLGVKD